MDITFARKLLTLLKAYENDPTWWSLTLFEEKADLQDFMLWLEDQEFMP